MVSFVNCSRMGVEPLEWLADGTVFEATGIWGAASNLGCSNVVLQVLDMRMTYVDEFVLLHQDARQLMHLLIEHYVVAFDDSGWSICPVKGLSN